MLAGVVIGAACPFVAAQPADMSIDYERIRARVAQENLSETEVARVLETLSPEQVVRLIEDSERIKSRAKTRLTLAERFGRTLLNPWVAFGFLAQFAFMMRFVVQLIASERKKRSYVPVAFWYLSLVGGVMLFVYALRLRDPVFVLGQGLGCFIYVRNLVLIYRRKGAYLELQAARRRRNLQRERGGGGEGGASASLGCPPPKTTE